MKKTGFTLIELLGVIVLISLISLLSFSTVLNQIKKSNDQINKITQNLVIDSAKNYLADNLNSFPKVKNSTFCLSVQELLNKNYLDKSVLDENESLNDYFIKIEYKSEYEYILADSCKGIVPSKQTYYQLIYEYEVKEDKEQYIVIKGFKSNVEISKYKNLVIPAQIDGIDVKKIANEAFKSKGLVSVTLPDGLTTIGNRAFEDNKLTRIKIPGSVKTIGSLAFSNNFNNGAPTLREIILEEGIEQINDYAFRNHYATELNIPGSVYKIYSGAFDATRNITRGNLKRVIINEGTKEKIFSNHIFNGHTPEIKVYVNSSINSNRLINWNYVINNNSNMTNSVYCDGNVKTVLINSTINCVYES